MSEVQKLQESIKSKRKDTQSGDQDASAAQEKPDSAEVNGDNVLKITHGDSDGVTAGSSAKVADMQETLDLGVGKNDTAGEEETTRDESTGAYRASETLAYEWEETAVDGEENKGQDKKNAADVSEKASKNGGVDESAQGDKAEQDALVQKHADDDEGVEKDAANSTEKKAEGQVVEQKKEGENKDGEKDREETPPPVQEPLCPWDYNASFVSSIIDLKNLKWALERAFKVVKPEKGVYACMRV